METSTAIRQDTFDGLPIHSVRYNAAQFNSAQFAGCGLECPPNIVRSVPKRQAEYFYGRLCARHALESIGIAGYTVTTGKQREPIWPAGVIGSISHNDEFAVAIALRASEASAIGIDVERIAEGESLAALDVIAISDSERTYLQSLSQSIAFGCALTIVFSAKESFFKACYPEVGRYFDFDAVTVTLLDPVAQLVELSLNETLSARLVAGLRCRVKYRFFDPATVFTLMRF